MFLRGAKIAIDIGKGNFEIRQHRFIIKKLDL